MTIGSNANNLVSGTIRSPAESFPVGTSQNISLDEFGAVRMSGSPGGSFVIGATGQVNGGLAVTDVAATALHLNGTGNSYVVSNAGSKTAFIAIGAAAVTVAAIVLGAVGGGYPILAGAIMTVSTSAGTDSYITAICLSGETTTLYISQGSGS